MLRFETFGARIRRCLLASVGLLSLVACGGSDTSPEPGDTFGADDPVYAVSFRIAGTSGAPVSGFAALVDSLDADTELDLGRSIEIPNGGLAVGPGRGGSIFLVDGATPLLEKVELLPDGSVEPRGVLSTQAFSISSNGVSAGNFIFLSETKAYVIDTLAFLIIIWNPESLEITGTIDFSGARASGSVGFVSNRSVRRDNELVFALSRIAGSTFEPHSALVFVDVENDSINRIVELPECAAVSDLMIVDEGSIYAASDIASVFNRLSGRNDDTTECFVRIPPGTYDVEDYTVFSERTGGRLAGTMLQLSDTRAYVRVLDESLLPSGIVDITDVNGALARTWGILDFAGDAPLDVLSDLDLKAGSTNPFIIDGAFWATESNDGFANSNLVDLSKETPVPGLTSPGTIINAFRVR